MSRPTERLDADRLAEEFLIAKCIWAPDGVDSKDCEDLHPELRRHLVADAFERGDFMLRYRRGEFYRWFGGRYFRISDSDMRCRIKRFLHDRNHMGSTFGGECEQYVEIAIQRINNIMVCLAGTEGVYLSEDRQLNTWDDGREQLGIQTFVFNNGILMTEDKDDRPVFRGHTPRYFTLNKLPYDYDPQADCPGWLDFLSDVMEGDAERIDLLTQWAGYLLTHDSRHHKFMLIAGEGQNGKTVFTTLLERMVGLDNVSHIQLAQFSNRFALASTLGKMLNSTSESCHGVDEAAETTLKSYTSGDRMTFEKKYRDPVHAAATAKIMISTNQLPQFADKSSGIWRRLLFVPFERNYPEHLQDTELVEKLSKELSGIFNWALVGLQLLMRTRRFIVPQKCKDAIAQYRRDVNPARAFLLDNYVTGFEYEGLTTQQVYDSYVEWCSNNGYRPMNHSNFGKEVKRTLPAVKPELRRNAGRRKRFYCGLAVKEYSPDAIESVEDCHRRQ